MDIIERNNVQIFGNGSRTLMFAHGFGCDQKMWRFVVPAFTDHYRVVLFDHVGSGGSRLDSYDSVKYSSLQGYADDVLEIMKALDLKDTLYVGHSVGSMIGLLASIQEPEYFHSIVMIGPSARYLNDPPAYYGGFEQRDIDELLEMMQMNFIGWASYMAPLAMQNEERKELSLELEQTFCSRDPHIARQFAEVTFHSDCRSILSDVSVPSLILQCSEDSIAPLEAGEYLHTHLKNSRIERMTAKGHYPQLSQPEETIQRIKAFLADS